MTLLAAHGVVAAATQVDGGEHDVQLVASGDVAALVTEAQEPEGRPRRHDLLRHSDVLQSAVASATVVPLRFGTLFESREELVEDFLRPQHEELRALLDELDGKVEMSFTASLREEEVLRELVAADPEISALREATLNRPEDATYAERVRLGELVAAGLSARRAEVERAFLDRVTPHVVGTQFPHGDSPAGVRAALLVPRDAVEALESALEDFAREHADTVEARLLGPLPPYSFVGAAAESAA